MKTTDSLFRLAKPPEITKSLSKPSKIMTSKIFQTFCATTAILFSSTAIAQDATDPVGVVTLTVPAGSDAALATPLHRAEVFQGAVLQVDSSSVITVSGSPGWSLDQFSMSHYIFVKSGNKAGSFAVISSNTASQLTLSYVSEDLQLGQVGGLVNGDSVAVIPFWTLSTLFPDSSTPDGAEVLLFDRESSGINLSSSQTFTNFDDYGWFNGSTEGNDMPIYPDESFILRTPTGSPMTISFVGNVNMDINKLILTLVESSVTQDIRISSTLPIPIGLQQFIDPGAQGDGDEVLFFDNSASGVNKSSTQSAVYFDGFGWFNGSTNMNDFPVNPGEGIIYRKSGDNNSELAVVVPDPTSVTPLAE